MPLVGVIGGSGLYGIPGLRALGEEAVRTPYGEPSAPYVRGEIAGLEVAFLPRHGRDHGIQPHRINYRANLYGFKQLGAERIITVNATGGMAPGLKPGHIVALDQVIDMTQGAREATFFDGDEVVHIDFTEPYCPELRDALIKAGGGTGINVAGRGTYLCVNGPRLESKAEIAHFAKIGGHVVGMTGMPEAALARELEICLAGLAVVTNFAAGISERKLTTDEVVEVMRMSNENIKVLLKAALGLVPHERKCPCRDALKGARM
jgi:5'-methylthioadenosine phosphorylase